MLAPFIATLLIAPVAQPSPGPTDESAIYEPPAASEEGLEPVEITPPPPRPEPSPEPEAAPKSEAPPEPQPPPALAPLDLPPPPPPPSGAGRLVGGTLALGLGLGAASVVIVEAARDEGNPRFVSSTFVPLGLVSLGVGTYLLVRGAKARANFNDWRAYTNSEARPSGDGLLVGGTMGVVIGGVTLVAAAVQTRDPRALEGVLTPTLFGVGGAGVALGVGALTWGLLRRSRYRSWRQATFLGVVPTFAPTRGGLQLGVAGRF